MDSLSLSKEFFTKDFDEDAWTLMCQELSEKCKAACGDSFVKFTQMFSDEIDRQVATMPVLHRLPAKILAAPFGYMDEGMRNDSSYMSQFQFSDGEGI